MDPLPSDPATADPEADGKGLVLVDLFDLYKRFSLGRYREDVLGFLAAWLVVAFLVALAWWSVWLGS